MLRIQRSPSDTCNTQLKSIPRRSGQGNGAYIAQHGSKKPQVTHLVLIGGTGPVDFRVRAAQAEVRDDLQPSAWSHLCLLGPVAKAPNKTCVHEVSLYGRRGIGYPPETNGVSEAELGDYDDPKAFPNVAVLNVPVKFSTVKQTIDRFKVQRTLMDAVEHQLAWWAYVWGVGRTTNPLLDQVGVPSAAFVEYVTAAVGYDLVPAFPSRSSCPEAIWQSARWWHEHPRMADDAGPATLPQLSGAYDAEHYLVPRSS